MHRYFTDLDFRWAMQGGLKMLSIRSNRHESFPLLSIRHTGSRFARRDTVRIESRRNVRIESNRKVPLTNRLCLGVLDMDDHFDLVRDLLHGIYLFQNDKETKQKLINKRHYST